MTAARRKQPKKQTSIVAEHVASGAKSAVEMIAEAPKKYFSAHYQVAKEDYEEALNAKHRFYSVVDGRPLNGLAEVRAAISLEERAVSFE